MLAGLPLLNSDDSRETRFAGRLVGGRYGSVVIGLVHETEDEDPADGREHRDEVECPAPGAFPGDEGGDEWTEVGGDDDEARPDVDFTPRTLRQLDGLVSQMEQTYGCSWKKNMSLINISPPCVNRQSC